MDFFLPRLFIENSNYWIEGWGHSPKSLCKLFSNFEILEVWYIRTLNETSNKPLIDMFFGQLVSIINGHIMKLISGLVINLC